MFELNKVKYDFQIISVETALEVQTLMMGKSDETAEQRLIEIAYNHLRIYLKEDKKEKVVLASELEKEYVAQIFGSNPFFMLEILLAFKEVIEGFLGHLPKFQKLKAKMESQNTNK